MQLLFLIFLASAQVLTSNAQCIILPITPTEFNGLAPCGYGSLTAGCVCCPDAYGQTACLSPIKKCVLGLGNEFICVNNPQYTSSCASEGLANCGTGCMPSSATCCPGQTGWCSTGYHCGTTSNCILDTLSSSSSHSPSPAAVPTLSPSTIKTTATFLTAPVLVLSSATTQITGTSATTAMSALSSTANKPLLHLLPRLATARARRASLPGKDTAESAVLSQ